MTLPILETPVPVSFDLPLKIWIAWIASIGIGLGGLAAIAKFISKVFQLIRKVTLLINDVEEYGSVLRQIAKEFKSDSGSTLKDSMNRLEEMAEESKLTVEGIKTLVNYKKQND